MKSTKRIKVFICLNDEVVDTLPTEDREKLAERLSEAMSAYFTKHPEEYKEITK